MATPTQPDPKDVQKLIDLYQQVDRLTRSQAENMAKISASAGNVNKEIDRLQKELNSIEDSFSSIAQSLKDSIQEFSKYNTVASSTKKSFSSLQSIASKLLSDQSGFSTLSEKELKKIKEKIALESRNLAQNIASGKLTAEQVAETEDVLARTVALLNLTNDRLKAEKEINEKLGISGQIVDGIVGTLGKLGIESSFFEGLKEDMRDAAESAGSSKWSVFKTGLTGIGKGLKDALKDPVTQLTILLKIINFFKDAALKANTQVVSMGKALGKGAEDFRENLVGIESASSNINVTTENLSEAFGQLAESTGLAYEYTADQLVTQVKLTKQVGLQAEEAANIQKFGVLTGKTSEETYKSFVRGLTTARNQLKVGINFKATLAEASKVSGQLAANLGYNPERIGKAVVAMKAFGTTLEQTKSQGEALLNFESSLEAELKAELLTGQQINLERARAAALQGDQVKLAEELANQGMTLEKFSKMNVLAQQSYAQALGLSADQLSDQLQKQKQAQESGKSLAQITEEEAAQALERQTIQDQFNQGITKLQSLIGNLVSGPLGTMLDVLVKILNVVNLILQPFTLLANFIKESTAASLTFLGVLGAIYAMKYKSFLVEKGELALAAIKKTYQATEIGQLGIIQSIKSRGFFKTLADAAMTAFTSLAKIPVVGPVLGAAAAAAAVGLGMKLFSKGDDVVSPGYGKRVLSTPEGSIALNNKDTVIAGTNLGGGGGNESISPQIDLTPMIAAINAVKASIDRLYSKDTSVNMDSKKVGTTLSQKSYKVA